MKLPRTLHSWSLAPKNAITLQRRLVALVVRTGRLTNARFVAGLDASPTPDCKSCVAAVVLWDLKTRRVVEEHTAAQKVTFPYVPGLLSFREGRVLLAVLRKLSREPDVLMCDGQGIAHPRRFGIAAHIGVLTGIPSLGCAKSRLIGEHDEPGPEAGAGVPLTDKGEVIGRVLRTRDRVKPVYVSIGHKLDLESAADIVLRCCAGYRLPEPTRRADHISRLAARESKLRAPETSAGRAKQA